MKGRIFKNVNEYISKAMLIQMELKSGLDSNTSQIEKLSFHVDDAQAWIDRQSPIFSSVTKKLF